MALDLTSEQKETGKANFQRAVGELGLSRRDFMMGLLAAGATLPVAAAAFYGYNADPVKGRPVRAALIGSGDEGGVLAGEHNPEYLEFVAVSDVRPRNQRRIFDGEPTGPRKGFNKIYGADARQKIKVFGDYRDMLADKKLDIEAVVIALPLNLHAPAAIACMQAGKHVLCEKLMAWNITQCKDMIRVAKETDRILTIGHQRHYSLLYAHAVELLRTGVLGDVKHIRALWHRNNTTPFKADPADSKNFVAADTVPWPTYREGWYPRVYQEDYEALKDKVKHYGFKSVEELIRWRLYARTGGGLMAELGSHQLDASSIFLGKVHPLAVSGVGTRSFYRPLREIDDHVFTTFEFPGANHAKDKEDVVVVTYSSINTNSFEPYGECVMGTRGTMIVESEQNIYLYPEGGSRSTSVSVAGAGGSKPVLDASASPTGGPSAAADRGSQALGRTVSRGYREEMEHFAYCIRLWDQMPKDERPLPRCHGKVAMADAIIALTSNLAMKHRQRIEFKPEWFDPESPAVPDAENKVEDITA